MTQVLVIGATGPSLGVITAGVAAAGAQVHALIRDSDHADHARANGASQTVVGDLRDPQSLAAAAEGMDAVFHANPAFAPDEAALGRAMVRAAADAGVGKFIFLSVYHPTLAALRNHADKQPVEAALFESDLNFTILQPAMFMQNLAGAWDSAVASGQLVMPYSTRAKTSYVDLRDVADVAAVAVTTNRLDYGTFELASPGMLDTAGIADLMSAASGRPIEARAISVEDWLARTRLPAGPLRDGLATMMRHYDRHGFHGGNDLVLQAILRRQPRTLPGFINELGGGQS
jgi:uncharacterized protein YbjT (DUF2867 family)